MAKQKLKGRITVIRAEVSLTLPVDDRYYKFTFAQERELPPDAAARIEIDALWRSSKEEINKQVKELCKTLDYNYEKLL